jgi:hypothetical protein
VDTGNSRFHRYAVGWTPTEMTFCYDGQKCFEHSWAPALPLLSPQPFDQPIHLLLSNRHGHRHNTPTDETPKAGTLAGDWVRVWK